MGKIPYGQWLQKTFEAVKNASQNNYIICASVGLHQWEFLLYCASEFGINIRIYVPKDYSEDRKIELLHQFKLDIDKCRFIEVAGKFNGKSWWLVRDRKIFEDADIYYPIAICPDGNFEKSLRENSFDKKIIDKFRVDYNVPSWHSLKTPDSDNINPQLTKFPWIYLTHWTHTSYSPWCDETKFEFYRSALASKNDYSHSAFQGLKRILTDGKICATQRNIRGQIDVVSFTEIPPRQAIFFMKWRSGLIRHYWEPYGIAIERKILNSIGVKPVIYGNEYIYNSLDEGNWYLFQPIKGNKYFWTEEREWRSRDDFKISEIPVEKILIITRTNDEAHEINSRFGLKSIGII
ncbi:hypothetical protein J7L68_08460 [bacterium]|nr:hypothetical protein [bacterium]